jgi:hypothetical protein
LSVYRIFSNAQNVTVCLSGLRSSSSISIAAAIIVLTALLRISLFFVASFNVDYVLRGYLCIVFVIGMAREFNAISIQLQ